MPLVSVVRGFLPLGCQTKNPKGQNITIILYNVDDLQRKSMEMGEFIEHSINLIEDEEIRKVCSSPIFLSPLKRVEKNEYIVKNLMTEI